VAHLQEAPLQVDHPALPKEVEVHPQAEAHHQEALPRAAIPAAQPPLLVEVEGEVHPREGREGDLRVDRLVVLREGHLECRLVEGRHLERHRLDNREGKRLRGCLRERPYLDQLRGEFHEVLHEGKRGVLLLQVRLQEGQKHQAVEDPEGFLLLHLK
jgi:hypothetical protein